MKISDSNRFYLSGTSQRFVHIATVLDGLHEYMAFYDNMTSQMYIEELVGIQLQFIEDDVLVQEIADLLFNAHLTDLAYGIATVDNEE